mmetsp:Transcript_33546/g.51429  ORF Transcript_33546/g.51429 Transcript_33546/m.51429 type:complete len:195 (+) Transcript_33546:646-1230(+)
MQQRESAKKAAASAAAAAVATGRNQVPIPVAPSQGSRSKSHNASPELVARTASWLDRANAILGGGKSEKDNNPRSKVQKLSNHSEDTTVQRTSSDEVEKEMKEVQRLINEGPIIQQTTAGLTIPYEVGQQFAPVTHHVHAHHTEEGPADKRPRTSRLLQDTEDKTAEDAEALVGFLNSVRASAAAASGGADFHV